MRQFPTLFKKTSTGAINEWDIQVKDNGGTATIVIAQGHVDGAKQIYEEVITEGKNLGKSNATTPLQQAIAEAEAKWVKQQDRRQYGTDPSGKESAEKRAAAPMLAQKYQDHFKKVDWSKAYMQPKLDGNRCLAKRDNHGVISLWTRGNKEIVTLPHIQEALRPVMRNGETFDGEVYIHGTHVTNLRSFLTREQSGCELVQLRLYDIVVPLPFDERISLLSQRLTADGDEETINLVETVKVLDEAHLMKFQAACIQEGFEGAMLRWGPFPYEAGKRSKGLLKVKTFEDAEFPIIDVTPGTSTFQDCAILWCRTQQGNLFAVTAPGTIEQKRQILLDKAQVIGKRVTIKYAGMTRTENPVPFQPIAKIILD
jgi:ATP-dependent DNA ligase